MDTQLVEQADSPRVAAAGVGVEVSFAESAEVADLVRIDQDGSSLTLALEGAQDSDREVSGSTATYGDVLPGVDLSYEVVAGAVKESLVLQSVDAVQDGAWTFGLTAAGMAPRLSGDAVEFTDAGGAVVAVLPPIEVWDAAGARTGGTYSLTTGTDPTRLTVSVDPAWLTASNRAFPVVVDPTYTYGFGQQAETIAYQQSVSPCSWCGIRTGNARTIFGQNAFWRSAIRYNLESLAGKTVTGAHLDLQLAVGATTDMQTVSTVGLYAATTPPGFGAVGAQLAAAEVGALRFLQPFRCGAANHDPTPLGGLA
ncbi:hypothetical protein ACTD5D_21275 [Nocardia takedensis]|uniref:hypothetical protein n=1 Tax=Nocardia takedensis TaxID=259390 RepID=UPI003F77377A